MLIPFDDYPVHQTPLPLAQSGFGSPDHYDRFWFNGFRDDLMFGVAFCSYPNRQIMDGAFSVLRDGRQTSLYVSGRANPDPTDTRMGPLRIEIVEPMRVNRVIVDAPEHGIGADLRYTAKTPVFEEARQTSFAGSRLVMDCTRATQWGTWTGSIEIDGERIDLGPGIRATKDRSWGQRSTPGVGLGAPSIPKGLFFLWAPVHFEDHCFHYLVFENPDGSRWVQDAAVVPMLSDEAGAVIRPARVEHTIEWAPGERRAAAAEFEVHFLDGKIERLGLRPLMTFRMKGLGYGHPRWAHGAWHGEVAVGVERIDAESVNPLSPENIHVQQLVRAEWRGQQGLGVLEQIVVGPYPQYGFRDFLGGGVS
ncbi:hypothetical protein [Nocardia miyunensis]|uniref:hypothetical protein n=1 Tax=Nocardia miyunensis TaxID=282684 RepID=UPI0008336909|nr:hypothetical protein [Nocardia miyunensis]